jgi:hypothetical protein
MGAIRDQFTDPPELASDKVGRARRPFKFFCVYAVVIGFLLFVGNGLGFIGFCYPHIIEDQPLEYPVKVSQIQGMRLVLEDGRCLEVQNNDGLGDKLIQADYLIQVESYPDGEVFVHARQEGWICGRPWAQPIRIPLIPQTTYRNRIKVIASGKFVAVR